MGMSSRVLAGALALALGGFWGCGPSTPEKTPRSKQADGVFNAPAARSAGKSAPTGKPGAGAKVRAPEALADVAPDTAIEGTLAPGDAVLDDGSFADFHAYRGRRGERVVITLESDDFDAYLLFGLGPPSSIDMLADDDDSGGGLNSRLELVLPEDGRYTIVVNSLDEGETGRYVLRIGAGGGAGGRTGGGGGGGMAVSSVERNSSVQGRLEETDLRLDDGTVYDMWMFQGRAGERITATMTSGDFDAYLVFATGRPDDLDWLAEDDDGAGGTDARIEITIPEDGVFVFLANSFEPSTGAYSLRVDSAAPADYASLYPGGGDPNGRYALLVGIDDYPGDGSDLASPVADARLMRDVLINKFGYDPANIVMLLDRDGNREHIINAFTRHLGQAGPLGTALFYYSGHGFQLDSNVGVRAPDDPEPGDGKDEALYVWGVDERSTTLLDDEIGELIDVLSTSRTLVILDSCSSGSGSRGPGTPKRVTAAPNDVNSVAQYLYVPRRFGGAYKAAAGKASANAGLLDGASPRRAHVLLAGSQDDDFSYVATGWPDRGGVASVFTYYLVGALEAVTPTTTFRDLQNTVQRQTVAYTKSQGHDPIQTPQIGGELGSMRVAEFFAAGQEVRRGVEAYRAGNHAEAARLIVPVAEDAGVDAWLALASMYEKGEGVRKDAAAAYYYAQRALSRQPGLAAAQGLAKQLESQLPAAAVASASFWGSRSETRLDPDRFICTSWTGRPTVSHGVTKFRAGASIQQMASDVVYYSGLAHNFEVVFANVGNAAAGVQGVCGQVSNPSCQRVIAWDPGFLQEVNALGTPWAAYSIMGHEVGHHLQGHTIDYARQSQAAELEADEFSGFILARMGASLGEAQLAMGRLIDEAPSDTHPGRSQRLQSIESGWNRGRSLGPVREGGQPMPPIREEPAPPMPRPDATPPRPRPGPSPGPGPGPMPPQPQIAQVCATQMGSCPMMVPVPVGSYCYCQTQMGGVPGIAR